MSENIKNDLEKVKEELGKQSEEYAEQVKIKKQEEMQKKVDLIWDFVNQNHKNEYNIVTKIVCRLEKNAVEDYIELLIYSNNELLVQANNILGIEKLSRISVESVRELLNFICSRSLELYELDHKTVIEINIEKGE